jgi:uncharacterized protein (TIGR03435 family)
MSDHGRQRGRIALLAWLLAAIGAAVPPMVAQGQQNAPTPSFAELTVRRAAGIRQLVAIDSPDDPGSYVIRSASLKDLIGLARYGEPGQQISGGPAWLDSYGFDVTIVLKPGTGDRASALRYVLERRFGLATHIETEPVYVLEASPSGARLREAAPDPNATTLLRERAGRLEFRRGTTANLAAALTRALGRPVLDHSGLRGRLYDFDLEWPLARPLSPADPLDKQSALAGEAAAVANALREQLGLGLRSFAVQTLVIDRAVPPVDD